MQWSGPTAKDLLPPWREALHPRLIERARIETPRAKRSLNTTRIAVSSASHSSSTGPVLSREHPGRPPNQACSKPGDTFLQIILE